MKEVILKNGCYNKQLIYCLQTEGKSYRFPISVKMRDFLNHCYLVDVDIPIFLRKKYLCEEWYIKWLITPKRGAILEDDP